MRIEVKLYSELKRFAPGDSNVFSIGLPPGATVQPLLEKLKVPGEVPRFIMVDGRRSEEESPLADGCTVVMFTPGDGG